MIASVVNKNFPELITSSQGDKEVDQARLLVSDLMIQDPEALVASSDLLGWQNIRVIHVQSSLDEMMFSPSDSHCLVLNLGSDAHVAVTSDKVEFEGEVGVGQVSIIPAGSSWRVCQTQSADFINLPLLYLRPLFVRSVVAHFHLLYPEFTLSPQIGFVNRHIRHMALSLLEELNEANLVGRLYADWLATGLAMQMVRRYSSLRNVRIGRGGMAPQKLRKAVDIIDSHLVEEQPGRLALRFVADEVGMSYFHFSRAFKQSMGMSLTNYIAEKRIEHAKELLNRTVLPISEIALRSGFGSQSHFTTSFRRMAGSTPREFRAAM